MASLIAGACAVDFTPDADMLARGLPLCGFGARTAPATGVHDPLTARAVAVGDTCIVACDVIGFHEDLSARIRARCVLPDANVIVTATHTHGAPFPVPGRLGGQPDPAFLRALEDACVAAIDGAVAARRPVTITAGIGADPGVAKNRRHPGGPVDGPVPVLRIRDETGGMVAVVVAYACHPVVLGADNLRITADYPGVVRSVIEAAYPGAVALFLTGCCGDANTGHSAAASLNLAANPARSFPMAQTLGARIADAALAAPEQPLSGPVTAHEAFVTLDMARRETDLPALAALWRGEITTADPVRKILLTHWIGWAERFADTGSGTWTGRVSLLNWAGMPVAAMPGEIFGQTGRDIRAVLGPAFVLGYADSFPGYIPPASEFPHGGYEVDEAHRFIGMPASFAPGSAERLAEALLALHGP